MGAEPEFSYTYMDTRGDDAATTMKGEPCMASINEAVMTTTIQMPIGLRARLDDIRAARTRKTGKRPANNDLLVEAVKDFVKKEGVRR